MAGTFSFEIVTPNRAYQLRAGSLEELRYWMEGLNAYKEFRKMNPLLGHFVQQLDSFV